MILNYISDPSDLYKIKDPSFSLNYLDSDPNDITLCFYNNFHQDKIPWSDLFQSYSSICLHSKRNTYIGDITEILTLPHVKKLTISGCKIFWTMNIIMVPRLNRSSIFAVK